jgi:hypothetical protein
MAASRRIIANPDNREGNIMEIQKRQPVPLIWAATLLASLTTTVSVHAACPAGEAELLPNLRAMPAHDIAMRDADYMKFSATSWNAGDGRFELVARAPDSSAATQQIDQRVYCSGGSYYDRPAGVAEYHAAHNHVHFNDYANYILEDNTANPQNSRQGTKTSFCIMDTTVVNQQLPGASNTAVYDWCPTQEPEFRTQGMSVGWGDTYGSHLAGQEMYIADLPAGMYRLRHSFDPKNRVAEKADDDNESCVLVEIGDGSNGRYVANRGPCVTPPTPEIFAIQPDTAPHNSCLQVIVSGDHLVPEMQLSFAGGTGPLPQAAAVVYNQEAGSTITHIDSTVCISKAAGGSKNPKLGNSPVWDVVLRNFQFQSIGSATLPDGFTVTADGGGGDTGGGGGGGGNGNGHGRR